MYNFIIIIFCWVLRQMGSCPPTRGALASSDVDDVHVKEAADEIVRAGARYCWMVQKFQSQPPFGWVKTI